jgi:hypothetical protein
MTGRRGTQSSPSGAEAGREERGFGAHGRGRSRGGSGGVRVHRAGEGEEQRRVGRSEGSPRRRGGGAEAGREE